MNLAREVVNALQESSDSELAIGMKQYMRNKFDFFGVASPSRKTVTKDLMTASRKLDLNILIQNVNELWSHPCRECQYVALDILKKNKNRFSSNELESVIYWVAEKSWWDTVDALASHIVGKIMDKHPEIIQGKINEWLSNEDIWLNRICLLFQLKYGEKTDFDLLKYCISKLKHKDDFFIQKAIGWSLRQYGKFNPGQVKDFIEATQLSNLARREGLKLIKI